MRASISVFVFVNKIFCKFHFYLFFNCLTVMTMTIKSDWIEGCITINELKFFEQIS